MFGFLKNLLGRPAVSPAENAGQGAVSPAGAAYAPSHPPAATGAMAYHQPPQQGIPVRPSGSMVEVSLQAIITSLPLELQPRIAQARVGDAMLAVPLERVLPQLSHGAVKLAFGEVRQAFPDVFSRGTDLDNTAVALPLAEVLSRINPNVLRRRRPLRKVEVPEDIASPFDKSGRGITIGKPDTAPPFPDSNAGRTRMNVPAAPAAAPSRFVLNSAPTPPPPAAAPLPPHTLSASPRIPIEPAEVLPLEPEVPKANGQSVPVAPAHNVAVPAQIPVPPEPPTVATVAIPLTALAEGWPEAVRKEIVQSNLLDLKVAFPADVLERALRT